MSVLMLAVKCFLTLLQLHRSASCVVLAEIFFLKYLDVDTRYLRKMYLDRGLRYISYHTHMAAKGRTQVFRSLLNIVQLSRDISELLVGQNLLEVD